LYYDVEFCFSEIKLLEYDVWGKESERVKLVMRQRKQTLVLFFYGAAGGGGGEREAGPVFWGQHTGQKSVHVAHEVWGIR